MNILRPDYLALISTPHVCLFLLLANYFVRSLILKEYSYATGNKSMEDSVAAYPSLVLASLGVGRYLD